MRSRASREELIRWVISQLLTSMQTVSPIAGGMTLPRCQGNNSQLFGIALSIYDPSADYTEGK